MAGEDIEYHIDTFDVKQFFQEWAVKKPKIGTNCGVAVYSDGYVRVATEMGCHGWVSDYISSGLDHPDYMYAYYPKKFKKGRRLVALYTSLWSHTYDDSDLEYWRFICNEKYSPWREQIKGREIIFGQKEGKEIPIAVKITDMNASSQVVVNFLMATRIIYGQPGYARAYKLLRKAGFTRTEAVYLTANFGVTPAEKVTYPYIGDYPFDTALTDMDWKKWSTGKPEFNSNKKLNTNAEYTPCNAIWNKNSGVISGTQIIYSEQKLKNTIIQDLISEERKIKNIFGKEEIRRFPLSIDEAVKKLKDDMEAWKCPKESTSQPEQKIEATPSSSIPYSYATDIPLYATTLTGSTQLSFTVQPTVVHPYFTESYQLVSTSNSTW